MSSSIAGSSQFSTASKTDTGVDGGYSSFKTAMCTENPYRPSFGAKELRFDGQLELKEYFNRDPGPGTYGQEHGNVE